MRLRRCLLTTVAAAGLFAAGFATAAGRQAPPRWTPDGRTDRRIDALTARLARLDADHYWQTWGGWSEEWQEIMGGEYPDFASHHRRLVEQGLALEGDCLRAWHDSDNLTLLTLAMAARARTDCALNHVLHNKLSLPWQRDVLLAAGVAAGDVDTHLYRCRRRAVERGDSSQESGLAAPYKSERQGLDELLATLRPLRQ